MSSTSDVNCILRRRDTRLVGDSLKTEKAILFVLELHCLCLAVAAVGVD